jgi:hypothetical protein
MAAYMPSFIVIKITMARGAGSPPNHKLLRKNTRSGNERFQSHAQYGAWGNGGNQGPINGGVGKNILKNLPGGQRHGQNRVSCQRPQRSTV